MSSQGDRSRASQIVTFDPPTVTRRLLSIGKAMHAESVQVVSHEPLQCNFRSNRHLLIAAERAERYDGETSIEGLPKSVVRNCNRKLTFVPAGHQLHGWQKPRALTRLTYFYIDPTALLLDPELGFAETELQPRMFIFNRDLWETSMKLRTQVESPAPGQQLYTEALSLVLLHELLRVNNGTTASEPVAQGGLATWQQKRVLDYIDVHLADDIPLATLAGLAKLSPFHFSRAFQRSLGIPPHRYHIQRRIEQAKYLLTNRSMSMTEIGLQLGFSESSAFTATFRRFTGRTPREFRRSLM